MRIFVKSKRIYLKVEDWFCKQENITRNTAEVIMETEKAILLNFGSMNKWIPKSLLTTHKVPVGLGEWIENE